MYIQFFESFIKQKYWLLNFSNCIMAKKIYDEISSRLIKFEYKIVK